MASVERSSTRPSSCWMTGSLIARKGYRRSPPSRGHIGQPAERRLPPECHDGDRRPRQTLDQEYHQRRGARPLQLLARGGGAAREGDEHRYGAAVLGIEV